MQKSTLRIGVVNFGTHMGINYKYIGSSYFFVLVNSKLNKKEISHSYFKQILALLLQALFLFILNLSNVLPVFIISGFILIHYIYACIFFQSSHIVSLFWVIVYALAAVIADALTTIIPTRLLHVSIDSILAGGNLRIPFTLVYITLLAIIIVILLCFSSKTFKLSLFEKIVFIFLSVLCISIEELIVVSQSTIYMNISDNYINLLYIIFFLVIVLFVVLIFYVYNLGTEKEKNIRLSKIHIQSEMEKKQYEQIISSIAELRYMKHDINNHLETIRSFISNGKYSEADNYINDLTVSLNRTYYTVASGNSTVDSIITNKLIQCKSLQIMTNYTILLPNRIPLSNIELCSLLGNLFDNAIDACCKIEDVNNRMIDFYIKPYKDMFSLMICNKSNGDYMFDKSDKSYHFLSTKRNANIEGHGLGLKRIIDIVETHNGIIDITPDSNEFRVSILIPLDIDDEEAMK